ncbi:MAG: hypothetical protein ACO3PR_11035 [Limisphaerales bacterium]|jgi:hypothetical protein|nr:hypothetical protein [Verrucomicrobiota bacterium]
MSGASLDPFKQLGLRPSLWMDLGSLKARYLQLAASCHPDHETCPDEDQLAGNQTSELASELHQAYGILSRVSSRIKSFLIEYCQADCSPLKIVPEDLGDRFMEVGALLGECDRVLANKPAEDAPELTRVVFMKQGLEKRQHCQALRTAIEEDLLGMEVQLKSYQRRLDADSHEPSCFGPDEVAHLVQLYHRWNFLERWKEQLSQRILEFMI